MTTERYIAFDNTNAGDMDWAGWELVDTEAIPPKTFAVCMPELEAKLAAAAMNGVDNRSKQIVELALRMDQMRQALRQCVDRLNLCIKEDRHKLLDVVARDAAEPFI